MDGGWRGLGFSENVSDLLTFGDAFGTATAVPLFKLPALAAQAIRTNRWRDRNKRGQTDRTTKIWNMARGFDCPLVLECETTFLGALTKGWTPVIWIHLPRVED